MDKSIKSLTANQALFKEEYNNLKKEFESLKQQGCQCSPNFDKKEIGKSSAYPAKKQPGKVTKGRIQVSESSSLE